jgi:hypothetical protein
MMKMISTTKKTWGTMAAAASLVAMTGCAGDGATLGDEDVGARAAYLFGLSEAELLSIHPLVAAQHDEPSWLARNRAPFECARYGDLCAMVGEAAAERLTHDALFMALDGASLDAIVAATDRATALAQAEHEVTQSALARASDVDDVNYACGNHRMRIETFKVNPVIGSRYGKVTCKLQEDQGLYWGGTPEFDEVTARVEIVGTAEFGEASQTDVHSLTSPKVYPGANQTVRGECTGDHNGDVEFIAEEIN